MAQFIIKTRHKHSLLYLVISVTLVNCQSASENTHSVGDLNSSPLTDSSAKSSHHTQLDTLHIVSGMGDTLSLSKTTYNTIIDKHPEFFNEYPDHPDFAFQCANQDEFNSEVGQLITDNFYLKRAQEFQYRYYQFY